ncbi:MAG: hypothetical protein ACI4RB_00270 [Acutalibacteraceae bacterium]
MLKRIISFVYAVIMFIAPTANIPEYNADTESFKTDYTYVYVHGLGGWGEYDIVNHIVPYWGTMGGDLMKYLNSRGFDCAAASVSPIESCWDRACELYAQLTGTRTDYGKYHSEHNNHKRYGEDYTGKALIENFSAEDKINLLGHSFGGATVLQFLDLMADGNAEERAVTPQDELSPLFTGGKADWIYSLTTLAAPMNGSSAYYIKSEILNDKNATFEERLVANLVGMLTNPIPDGRNELDCAGYDMEVDRAMSLCDTWETQDNVYYFSFACDVTQLDENGNRIFDKNDLEYLFRGSAGRMVSWTGTTPSGYVIGKEWQANDGLVNTISALAPYNAPKTDFIDGSVNPGIWNVMPIYRGDHMSLQGGLMNTNNVRLIYAEHMSMVNAL